MHRFLILVLLLGSYSFHSQAQPVPNQSALTIEQIMQGEKFVGYLPEDIEWSPTGEFIYFTWNPKQDTLRQMFRVAPSGGEPQAVSLEEQARLPKAGHRSDDGSKIVYSEQGDLFLYEVEHKESKRLTATIAAERNPQFVSGGNQIIYQSGNNLFAYHLDQGTIVQLSNFQEGQGPGYSRNAPHQSWLSDQQDELFGILRERSATQRLRKERQDFFELDHPKAVHIGKQNLSKLQASPNQRFISCELSHTPDDVNTQVPSFVTDDGYIDPLPARSKVGSPQTTYQTGIYDRKRDTFYYLDLGELPGVYDKPAFLYEYHADDSTFQSRYLEPKETIIHGPYWNNQNQAVVVVRSMDNKDRWIAQLDPESGRLTAIDWQHDEAWIGGPGIIVWNFNAGTVGWLPDNEHFYFQSEATGFSHLYLHNINSGQTQALTNGPWEVLSAQPSKDGQSFFITANKESPHEQHLYRLQRASGKMEQITQQAGAYECIISPNEDYVAARYSYSNRPWELVSISLKGRAKMRQLTLSTTEHFRGYEWRDPEIINFEAEDGARVPARLYQPLPEDSNGAAVIFVHGAGYLQNVHRWWSSYYREYMFHNILVDNGYTVLDIDYRGSAGYGRDWRTSIYRHMGGKDLDDQVDGARYLTEELGIAQDRIGIYGGSYGGFITLMALFKNPGVFQCGAALRSVTDWAHYNHPYTSNILNTPVEDEQAFQRSSPINFADGLQDRLLMLHGMIDTNVQFQDVVRLSQRLIELGKDNWELAVFPLEGHGFVEPSSWADEYKRIFQLFQTTFPKD